MTRLGLVRPMTHAGVASSMSRAGVICSRATRVRVTRTAVAVTLALLVAGCTAETVKRGTYEALAQKQCMDGGGVPNCDSDRPSYDEYKHDRDRALRQGRQ